MLPPTVDAHHHLWDTAANPYAWLQSDPPPALICGDVRPVRGPYRPEEFRADVGDLPIVGSVHVEAGWSGPDPVDETRWLDRVAGALPTGVVVRAPLDLPRLELLLERHLEVGRVCAVRDIAAWHPDPVLSQTPRADLLTDRAWQRGFATLARYGLAFDLQVFPHQVPDAVALLDAHPAVPVAVEHALLPAGELDPGEWRRGLRTLARRTAAVVKVSGLAMRTPAWTVRDAGPLLRQVLDEFGPERTMLGSNHPVDRLAAPYAEVWTAYDEATADLGAAERDRLFRGTADEFYRLGTTGPGAGAVPHAERGAAPVVGPDDGA